MYSSQRQYLLPLLILVRIWAPWKWLLEVVKFAWNQYIKATEVNMQEEMRNPYLKLSTNDLPSSLPPSLPLSLLSFLPKRGKTNSYDW